VLTDAVRVHELVRVLRLLEDAGVMPLVFKGAALAHTHYGESWRRPRYDADVLITLEDRDTVFAILEASGYTRRTFVSGDLVMYQLPFERTDHLGVDHALDIHWRIANPQVVSQVLNHDELVARSVIVDVVGHPMRVPCAVDALLLACVHRVAHHPDYDKPAWAEDIHLLAARFTTSEWQDFVARATSRSIRALCLDGVMLARARFHTPLPLNVLTDLDAGASEPSSLFLRADLRPVDRLTQDLRALGPRGAVRLMREHLFPPAEYMRQSYGVRHRALLPAYYVVRVLGGVSKWFRVLRAA
jgi:hypothetical protein